ncbi:hypothetical protein CPIN17260_0443 [Campylobacter pinnipediorum subsp. pinnipediorum]|uniref:hypothetical protein n=1 Tax=Campylobacter pinnipediorum TaxID=1965231 RepID=UPI00084CF966|nr:hypothetical protein [Campylobacter pinnipediorum]AQW80771.1 hypothetical protein CPIN17260_0443 [Campylobacter pinnipediorum subsp. pinnipediorum]OPA75414.1 hypothetical protein BFG05_05950 [Campylobacter pinnipediorum subsp. pinnipediorum]
MNQTVVNNDIDILIEALRSLGGGSLLAQTANNLKDAISAVQSTKKTASVNIKITVKTDPNSENEIVVFGTTGVTLPKEPIKTRFYVSREFLPTRTAPDQLVMTF